MTHDAYVLTLDVDWASDAVIRAVADILVRHGVRATWFATHRSPAVDELLARPELFEVGLHPNCLPGSSHGADEEAVLAHMRELFPQATAMRTHGLYQSAPFLVRAWSHGVRTDASLLLHGAAHLAPVGLPWSHATMARVPTFWEDDVEMCAPRPDWRLDAPRYAVPGLKVFDFHPVHVAVNCPDLGRYEALKARRPVHAWTAEDVENGLYDGPGARTLFMDLVRRLAGGGRTVSEIAAAALPEAACA